MIAAYSAGAALLVASFTKGRERLALSRAKHGSLAGHVRLAKRIASFIPYYAHGPDLFFRIDGAPEAIAAKRREGFERLSRLFQKRFPKSLALTCEVRTGLSDLQFTATYRVPFQFRKMVGEHLAVGAFLQASDGVTVTDLDGNLFYDLTGSYGVNLFGYDFYKSCIREAVEQVDALGPVLGSYHPVVADNVQRLKAISGLDEMSFHMSGTEAVMQAVRLARYHSGRSHVVRFCGAYHGWWDDVQPGVGNPLPANRTYTLADMSERTLTVLARRRNIACVLVNPLQALHPNQAAPSDSTLIDSGRRAGFDRDAYGAWLKRLAEVCAANGIILIFDEIFVGFRLAPGGAAEYFGIRPDMITYGKTLGGGLPIGVLCGRASLMRRFRDGRPADICFARGTFNAHPYVMGAMNAFLRRLETPAVRALYANLDARWNHRAEAINRRLAEQDLPVEVANLSSIWTVCYTRPSRYNWMFQYYLRAEGLALSWVGTGRLIFSLDHGDAEFEAVADRFIAAAKAMRDDGWWWSNPGTTNRRLRRDILKEILGRRLR
ncbi:aminotransferase class III-fold pyridoxal phosphate-dependent enzyme [Sphingosinicella rhizophila]|uniref:Aminotransferase class III-fold pyridoxal phosphate-dependent enzyme n=1 Tax=Sphingosinicella rhizophila TaxID=3050082 RepID=A0ABU3Q7C3_9SPHN|nr:aminotransferase class III-fold pyridoxal phosphate-dependent enzyme [Sphingosinicella sp. GR2756]MDT9599303.1 aminotransferase class III-fold pyridoxal phosphate-dependent enzyme [Sphingosinicella sp. GR2756]